MAKPFLTRFKTAFAIDAEFRLTPDTQSDLLDIRRFTISQWGATQAQRYLAELRRSIQRLAQTPSLGKASPDMGTNVSSFPHASHIIYYIVHEQQLVVFSLATWAKPLADARARLGLK